MGLTLLLAVCCCCSMAVTTLANAVTPQKEVSLVGRPYGVDENIIKLSTNALIKYDTPPNYTKKSVKILFWNTMYRAYSNWQWHFDSNFMKKTCPDLPCQFTMDQNELNSSDAVVFHIFNLCLDQDQQHFLAQFPPHRFPHQRWIFFDLEADQKRNISRLNGLFNLTMTYRKDSDVPTDYHHVILNTLPTPELRQASHKRNFAAGKTKLVAWYVSHCKSNGGRESFVQELQKYIPVDIYGGCGKMKCNSYYECLHKLSKEYKFYLSFENSICKDYVSEKLFNALTSDVVPVVFGGADYTRFIPSGSFIDALSFPSPRHLAEFVLALDEDEVEYNKYFDWRRGFTEPQLLSRQVYGCELCSKLVDPAIPPKVYPDMYDWWVRQANCQTWRNNTLVKWFDKDNVHNKK